VFTNFLY
jgi:hypothetical protein